MAAARWAMQHGEPAGHGTSTLPSATWHFRPIRTAKKIVGVLGLRQGEGDPPLRQDMQQTMDSILDQSAIAIERLTFAEEAARVEAMTATDRLRTALMSSVSHDLRTPLTTILGSASTLRQDKTKPDETAKDELLLAIVDETKRLDQYVTNLSEYVAARSGRVETAPRMAGPDRRPGVWPQRVGHRTKGIADTRVGPMCRCCARTLCFWKRCL
jgi:two-component system sensor histidine kinase KdpD